MILTSSANKEAALVPLLRAAEMISEMIVSTCADTASPSDRCSCNRIDV